MSPNKVKKQPLEQLVDKAWECIALNDIPQAEKYLDTAFKRSPKHVRVRFLSGVLEYRKHNYSKSISILQGVLKENPSHGDAHVNIGSAYSESGILDKAEFHYRKALEINPNDHIALNNLGGLCKRQMRLAEAQILFEKSIEIKPDFWISLFNLGSLLINRKMLDKAVEYLRKAFELNKNPSTYANLIGALKYNHPEEAYELAKENVNLGHLDFSMLSVYPVLVYSCDWEMLDELQDKVLEIAYQEQKQTSWVQGILLPLNKPYGISREDIFEIHKTWGENVSHQLKDAYSQHDNAMKPCTHIRIGYLSADFREHSVGHFIKNTISNHDKTRFKVFCYSTYSKEDQITKDIINHSESYARIHNLTNLELAKKIYDDGIHILIDLNGHTAHTKVEMLKYSPAPVQITYLGYPNTTGLDAVDYRITDEYAESDNGTLYTEELIKMPESFLCFGNFIEQEIKSELPVQRKGYVTFGSFNNISKLNPETIKVWSQILHKLPESKLVIKSGNIDADYIQKNIKKEFIKHDIVEGRVELKGFNAEKGDHLDYYNEIDIALDSFPYQGTTTTCEALWMDVPVVSLVGTLHAQRVSNSIYKNIGIEDCLAFTEDEYINKAVSLASDVQANKELRKKIHTGLRESILCDSVRFTKQLENLYINAWDKKINKHPWGDFSGTYAPENSQLSVTINGNIKVCVPDDLNLPTPYILLEQEDWIEPEFRFIEKFLLSGMNVVDIGANYGLYTLLASKQVGSSGNLWAIEHDLARFEYIKESLKINYFNNVSIQTNLLTIDEYATEHNWKNIDFIRLDTEEIDEKIFTTSNKFYDSNSPLIMIRTNEEDRHANVFYNHLASFGYKGYMLIPGLDLLAPYKPDERLDPYQVNLFFCKDDCADKLSLRGILIKENQLQSKTSPAQAGKWIEHLQNFPYVTRLLHPWLRFMEASVNSDSEQWILHQHALDNYAMAHDSGEAVEDRYAYLISAYYLLAELIKSKGNFSNIQSLIRIASELGKRSEAVDMLEYFMTKNKSGAVMTFDEPFLCVSIDYEKIDPEENIAAWVNASIIYAYEKNHAFSSYFSGKSSLERLDNLKKTGFFNCEMERRRQLIRLRYRLQNIPESVLLKSKGCNSNDWFWLGNDYNKELKLKHELVIDGD